MTTTCLAPRISRLMLDHPGWFTTPDGYAQRAFLSGKTVWLITCRQLSAGFEPKVEIVGQTVSNIGEKPRVGCIDPAKLPKPFRDTPIISEYGHLHRVRSADLWESMLPRLPRRQPRTIQGIQRYRKICAAIGGKVTTSLGTVLIAPRAETVLAASDDDWSGIPTQWIQDLRKAAELYLERRKVWARYPLNGLYHALHEVPGMGSMSAAETVADFTSDFRHYTSVDFGTSGRWQRFSRDLNETVSTHHFETAWKGLATDDRSALTALSIDWNLREIGGPKALRFQPMNKRTGTAR